MFSIQVVGKFYSSTTSKRKESLRWKILEALRAFAGFKLLSVGFLIIVSRGLELVSQRSRRY